MVSRIKISRLQRGQGLHGYTEGGLHRAGKPLTSIKLDLDLLALSICIGAGCVLKACHCWGVNAATVMSALQILSRLPYICVGWLPVQTSVTFRNAVSTKIMQGVLSRTLPDQLINQIHAWHSIFLCRLSACVWSRLHACAHFALVCVRACVPIWVCFRVSILRRLIMEASCLKTNLSFSSITINYRLHYRRLPSTTINYRLHYHLLPSITIYCTTNCHLRMLES